MYASVAAAMDAAAAVAAALLQLMLKTSAAGSQRQNWIQDLPVAQLLLLMWLLLLLQILGLLLPLLLLQKPRRWQAQWAIEIIFHGQDGQSSSSSMVKMGGVFGVSNEQASKECSVVGYTT